MNHKLFSSEVELGKFIGSIGVIPDAYRAISETSSTFELHTTPTGIKVLAFDSFGDYSDRFHNREFNLVSSEGHEAFDFILTKVNPKFSINKAALELFEHHFVSLLQLRNQFIDSHCPLVVTGRGLGGYLAILFALLHHHAIDVEESNGSKTPKRPICITFGSPLLGDDRLQHAISEHPQWKSCFLNIVAKTDPLASFFSSNTLYKPFGTFLFCAESGGHTVFEDEVSVFIVLDAMASSNVGNSQTHDYTNELGFIRRKALYRGTCELGQINLNSLRFGIMSQFQEVGVLNDIPIKMIAKIEDKRTRMIKTKRKVNTYEPTKKLNDMKISLTYMEWYMKSRRSKGGYYDAYKLNAKTKNEIESRTKIITHQGFLNQYWKKIVEETNRMPQKEGANLRRRWLYCGTNYRRIVEPLDIADHYRRGKTNYMAYRSNHYKLLEKWANDEKKNRQPTERKTKAACLTEDSCFWAYVEEALILLEKLKNRDPNNIAMEIEEFEVYVLGAIKDFSVSPDVFLEGSSLMKWWSEYRTYKGSSYRSEFAQYMNDGRYTSYQ
ncbi:hypothetical protein L2E82_19507 [Cichorium intybus]|uniref:Uncharacterized protein n=1 Tax=Cichorium intybus TaxID=13427 RepID=A0ACB9FBZ5_CICIN|nr:hypothetical protein L2E82_19507 [Cichorium intybus]